jgi:2-iminobutanoate/2-iminopropanoate deaminase
MKKAVKTKKAPAAPGLLSQAIEQDGLIFTSGQIHLTTDGSLVKGSMAEKTKQVMSNLKAILKAAGLGFENVLKTTVYVTDMAEYGEFNKVYINYFKEPFPAREVICVKELPLGASLEVSLVAKK